MQAYPGDMLIWQSNVDIVGTNSLAADGLTYFIPSCSRSNLLFHSGERNFKAAERNIVNTKGIFFGRKSCTKILGQVTFYIHSRALVSTPYSREGECRDEALHSCYSMRKRDRLLRRPTWPSHSLR